MPSSLVTKLRHKIYYTAVHRNAVVKGVDNATPCHRTGFDTVRPAASKAVTRTFISLASPSADFETIPASSAHYMPPLFSDHRILLEVNQIPDNVFVLAEAY